MMNNVRVGILRGGANKNYETSVREGGKMIAYITETLPHKAKAIDVFVDKEGFWHLQGVRILPMDLVHKVDVLWDTTIPAVSQVLEGHIPLFKIPYFAASMTTSKALLREHMKTIGVQMPLHIILPAYQEDIDGALDTYALKKARDVHAKFGAPWLIKSFTSDANVGIHVAKTFPELVNSIADLSKHGESILAEELIPGKIGGVHTIAGFRSNLTATRTDSIKPGSLYHMLPYEIRYHGVEPAGNFSDAENQKLYALSESMFKHLGAKHYLHFNFYLNKRGGIYVTDVSLMPDFSEGSQLSLSSNTIGTKSQEVFEHILQEILN